MERLIVSFLSFVLIGCAPATWNPGYATFSILKPEKTTNMSYSDQRISVNFAVRQSSTYGVEGIRRYVAYKGLAFTLVNNTDNVIIIDWNKISFVDYTGSSGNAVMHKDVKFNECASPKTPTTIPPRGRVSDIIIPCYAISFEGSYWHVSMLPSPRQYPKAQFGVFMPIQIGKQIVNYEFSFVAESYQH